MTSLGAVLVLLARDLHVSPGRLGWLASAFGAGLLLVAAAGPRLLRRGPQPTLRAAALVLAAGAGLLAVALTRVLAVTGALLLGLGGAGMVLVIPVLLRGPGAAARLTRANAAASTAGVLAPLALGAMDSLGPSGRLALLAAVPPLLALAATTGHRTTQHTSHDHTSRGSDAEEQQGAGPAGRPSRPDAARRWARVVLAVSVEFCFVVWAVARLQETGVTPSGAAALGSTFPIGMALGRLAGPRLLQHLPVIPLGAVVTAAGALLVTATNGPAPVAAGLAIAGLGVATLYPVLLADLVATPGLWPAQSASLGALASGTAILLAPSALAALGRAFDLRLAFLITIPLLIALTALHTPTQQAARP